jgi:hypothetical protein
MFVEKYDVCQGCIEPCVRDDSSFGKIAANETWMGPGRLHRHGRVFSNRKDLETFHALKGEIEGELEVLSLS